MATVAFYTLALAFLAGVGVFTVYPVGWVVLTWLLVLALGVGLVRVRAAPRLGRDWLLVLMLICIGLALGGARLAILLEAEVPSVLDSQVGQTITLEGVVVGEPDQRERTTHLQVETDDATLLVLADRYVAVAYGDVVSARGRLSRPESFMTEFGRTFNYPGYLKAQGIDYQMSFAAVEVLESGHGSKVLSALLAFKSAFTAETRALLAEPAAGLSEGLLLGVKQALGVELETAFRQTGIIHIVVLSGYNVMLVVAFVLFVLGYFFAPKPRMVFGILAIIAFALMVGLSATVVRASLMASILLIAQAFGRTYLVLRALILAGVVMVLLNPLVLLYDVGFQLSFLATLGLILVAPHFEAWLHRVPNFAGARSFVVATTATQVAVLPLLLYQIGEFSVVSVIVNVLVLPMVPVAMMLTFALGMVAFFSPFLASLIALPTYWSLVYIIEIARWFANSPLAAFTVPSFSWWWVFIGYTLMGLWLYWRYDPRLALGEADLGQRLIAPSAQQSTGEKPALSEWVIEEELEDLEPAVGKTSVTQKSKTDEATTKEESPIFFR